MFNLANKEVVLQGIDPQNIHKSFVGHYDDIRRLTEPDGRVSVTNGMMQLFWLGGLNFTADAKDARIWKGTRMQAMAALSEIFGNKDDSIRLDHVKMFYFESVSTPISFKHFKEEKYEGFKIWDRFNQMWREFSVYLGVNGVDVETKTPVTINFRDVVTDIRIYANIKNKVLTNAWVEKEGNLGVVEDFHMFSNNGLFEQIMLEALPEDHPGYKVESPSAVYPNSNFSHTSVAMHGGNHMHSGMPSLRPGSGVPY